MTARNAALKTLVSIDGKQAFSNIEINRMLRNQDDDPIENKDLFVNLVYGTLQHLLTIDYILNQYIRFGFNQLKPAVRWSLRIALYQILYLDQPDYAVVNEAVRSIKKKYYQSAPFVNGVLRNIVRHKDEIKEEIAKLDDLSVKYSVPEWIIQKYRETFGEKADKIFEHVNESSPITFRVKPGYYKGVYSALDKLGALPRNSALPELKETALILENPKALSKGVEETKAYQQGLVTVQDQGAMLISLALDPKPGEVVLDMCSAPGGKTTHIAELMDHKGVIIACDSNASRLKLVEASANRTNSSHVIKPLEVDGTKFHPEFKNRFDRVLIDAPCSGLGTIRKKPDLRYRVKPEDSEELGKIQLQLLNNAFEYLKPGGKMVYSTCTVGKEENEDVVEAFIKHHEKYAELISQTHTVPGTAGADSFYFAVIEKRDLRKQKDGKGHGGYHHSRRSGHNNRGKGRRDHKHRN